MDNKSDNKNMIDKLNNRFITFFICIIYSVFAFLVVCSFANITSGDGTLTLIALATVIPIFIFMSFKPSKILFLSGMGLFLLAVFIINFKGGGLSSAISPFVNFFNDFYLVFFKFTKVPISKEIILLVVISVAIALFTYIFTSSLLNPQVLFLFATLALMFQVITGGLKNSIYFIFLIGISLFSVFYYVYQYQKSVSSYKDMGFFRVIAPSALITVLAFLISVLIPYFEIPALSKNIKSGQKNISYYSFNGDDEESDESMLGGPINPDNTFLFEVTTNKPVKLMGSIKTIYTGHSWAFDDRHSARYNGQKSNDSIEICFNLKNPDLATTTVSKFTNPSNTLFVPSLMESLEGESDAPFYIADDGTMTSKGLNEDSYYTAQSDFIDLKNNKVQKWLKSCHKGYYNTDFDVSGDDNKTLSNLKIKSSDVYNSCLQLPGSLPDRVYNKAKELTKGLNNDYDKAQAIATYLSNYTYSLNPEELSDDKDFVDHFLFVEKKGYCTYYASAFTVLCRCAGIPARYVEGYNLPVNYTENDDSSYTYKITNKEAHTWAQVYFEGAGWITFEPTAPYRYVEMGEDVPQDIFENPVDAQQFEEQIKEEPTGEDITEPQNPQETTKDESSGDDAQDITEPENSADNKDNNPPKEDKKSSKLILKIFIPVISILLLIFIIYFVTGSARKRKWHNLKNTINASRAIKLIYKESLKALAMINLKPAKNETLAEFFSRAEEELDLGYLPSSVFNRVIYGNKKATEEERNEAIKYFDDVKDVVSKEISKPKKFFLLDFLHKI